MSFQNKMVKSNNKLRVLRRSFHYKSSNTPFTIHTPTVIVNNEKQVRVNRTPKEQESALYCRYFGEAGKVPARFLAALKKSSKKLKLGVKVKSKFVFHSKY